MIPFYSNKAEILTYGAKDEGNLVVIRFFYQEPKLKEGELGNIKRPYPLMYPGAAVIMPRKIAKDFVKKFLGFMSVQDEHRRD